MILKLLPILSFVILIITSCSESETTINIPDKSNSSNELLGEWTLIERLVDPGNGSGTFQAVQSDKKIKFLENLQFESSEPLCVLIPSSHELGKGSYTLDPQMLFPDNCDFTSELNYQLDNGFLIINYLCIEPCAEKYQRISNN